MKALERTTYVAIGTADFVAEKVRAIPAVRYVRETSVIDQLKDIEPSVRRTATQLTDRGEKAVNRLRDRVKEARTAVGQLPVDTMKAFEGLSADARRAVETLSTEPGVQFEQLRTRVTETVGSLRTRNGRGLSKKTAA